MNSLASWIDRSLLDSIVTDLTSVEQLSDDFGQMLRSPAIPTQSLSHHDFRRPDPEEDDDEPDMAQAAANMGHTMAQLQKFRECLQSVSNRFQNSGLVKNADGADVAAATGATSPSGSSATGNITSKRGVSFFIAPQGTLGTRLRALQDWLHGELPSLQQLFIVDGQGCLASDHEPPPPILAASIVLADAARRTSRHLQTGTDCAMHTELSTHEKLCVITADSPAIGAYSIAMVSPYNLPAGSTDRIRAALLRALNGTPEGA